MRRYDEFIALRDTGWTKMRAGQGQPNRTSLHIGARVALQRSPILRVDTTRIMG